MKLRLMIAVGAAALLGASFSAYALPADETTTTPGKRLVSTVEVAQSRPGSFDVYIDEPTGFAFVNTPIGWVFTRKVPDAPTVSAEARSTR